MSSSSSKIFLISLLIISGLFLPRFAFAAANTTDIGNYNKSWIFIDASNDNKQLVSGQSWQVPVEYYLDPSEHSGTTFLYLWGTGPWIDTPDGKYTTRRRHIDYPNMSRQTMLTKPGRGRHIFTFTIPEGLELVKKNNPVMLVSGFRDSEKKNWPWSVRAGASFVTQRGFFDIETEVPGNLFTYDEPVRPTIKFKNIRKPGEKKTLDYKIFDTQGTLLARGQKEFTAEKDGQKITIDLNIDKRGVFLIEFDVPGWEKRHTTFARIPDIKAITKGGPTRFGMTTYEYVRSNEIWAIAQRLGLTTCRRFTVWYNVQPGPDFYKLDKLKKELEDADEYGIKTWLCIVNPPPFAFQSKAESINYQSFDCNWAIWRDFVQTVTTQLKGRLYGWEWLNEITPGGTENPVDNYLKMCRIGTETAKAIDPNIISILAGGLYPRSFRTQVLKAGIGKYIDVLPVHYQNGDGIIEARRDLDAAGYNNIAVWDDESAKGLNAWAVPPLEELQNTEQCKWILNQWADELAAGCEKITYFGGEPSATGNFGYMLDDLSPRPVAATLAVFVGKMAHAKPLGTFMLGREGLFHLFEQDNKPVLIASTYEQSGEKVNVNVGAETALMTDYQGNENSIPTTDGRAEFQLNPLPVFIENADIDVLKAYVVPQILTTRVGAGTSSNVATAKRMKPQLNMIKGMNGKLPVQLSNLYNRELAGNIHIDLPAGWPAIEPIEFRLEAGQKEIHEIEFAVPEDIPDKNYTAGLSINFDWEKLPQIDKPAVLSVVSPDALGNLIPNGDFEKPDATGKGPEGWRLNGKTTIWIDSEGLGDGLGEHVLKFQNTSGWASVNRTIKVRGGQTYLYTAWIRNENMGTGSNMGQHLADGSERRLYDVQVFSCGTNNPHWQIFTCRKQMPADTVRASFTPVANGKGWAMWDNIRVTVFEGTDYAAEAYSTKDTPTIDGNLNEWIKKCPIPLIGSSQITNKAESYTWSPDNLSAVGYLMWDTENLYVALKVRDNVHCTKGTGQSADEFIKGDSLILGIDPTHRGTDTETKSFAYYISAEPPGGGSGTHTIIRPDQYSGSHRPGHLFKDSSIYDMAIQKEPGICIYELKIPLTELGVTGNIGTKIGLSIQLNDNDGHGPQAQMNWGDGLFPKWSPGNFGVVTFIE
ncbi:MAG: hypothetical protein JW715_08340 [Sedimentisphaerales bacterium]|nr:hypothetical protein [Sedimentisphaerales bacterium]